MDEKTKDNKLNESEMDEISGGFNIKNLPPEIKKIFDDAAKFPPKAVPINIIVKYGYPPNWPPKKNPEQNPTDPVNQSKDITPEPKKPTDINISPNPESKN